MVQWNGKSLTSKVPRLQYNSVEYIFLLSETWLSPDDSLYVRGFDVLRRDPQAQNGGGVASLVKNSLRNKSVRNLYDCNGKIEVCVVELAPRDEKLIIVSCY